MIGKSTEIQDAIMGQWSLPEEEGDVMRAEGERAGLMNGGIWGLLGGLSIFLVPGLGEIAILGPLAGLLIGGAIGVFVGWVAGGSTAEEISTRYRQKLAAGHFLLMVTGPTEQMEATIDILSSANASEVERLPKHLKRATSSHKASLF